VTGPLLKNRGEWQNSIPDYQEYLDLAGGICGIGKVKLSDGEESWAWPGSRCSARDSARSPTTAAGVRTCLETHNPGDFGMKRHRAVVALIVAVRSLESIVNTSPLRRRSSRGWPPAP